MSELRFNVAQLLQEYVGATRLHEFEEPTLDLGDGLMFRDVEGSVKLTRTKNGVLTQAEAGGTVALPCVRCLETFVQPLEIAFEEEYHAIVHVTTGAALPDPDDDDVFRINTNHLLDLGDAIREYALLAVPIAPLCQEDCKGISQDGTNLNDHPDAASDDGEPVDERLAALKQLLKR